MGKVRIEVFKTNEDVVREVVDGLNGWSFEGDYLVLRVPMSGGAEKIVPIWLGEIAYILKASVETVH